MERSFKDQHGTGLVVLPFRMHTRVRDGGLCSSGPLALPQQVYAALGPAPAGVKLVTGSGTGLRVIDAATGRVEHAAAAGTPVWHVAWPAEDGDSVSPAPRLPTSQYSALDGGENGLY